MVPLPSDKVKTLPPKSSDFSTVYYDTFPDPETKIFLPAYSYPAYFNIL